MKSILLPIHLAFAGIWLGCVLTETLFEHALPEKGRTHELLLAGVHKRVDLAVEIPAFVSVLVTGALLLNNVGANTILHVKVAFGLVAIVANIYCIWLVFRRAAAATQERWEEYARIDQQQHRFGAVVLISLLVELSIGLYLYGHA